MAGDKLVDQALELAAELEAEKLDLQARRAVNRQFVRGLLAQGFLTDEQSEFIQSVYPPRTRKSGDDL